MSTNGSKTDAAAAKARGVMLAAISRAIAEFQPALEQINAATMPELWGDGFETLIKMQRLEYRLGGEQ